jgi:hypothetical protein
VGAIVGIVIAVLAVVAGLVILWLIFGKKKAEEPPPGYDSMPGMTE